MSQKKNRYIDGVVLLLPGSSAHYVKYNEYVHSKRILDIG